MRKLLAYLIMFLSLASFAHGACVDNGGGSWTASADLTSVASCVLQAARGDTVNVSAGTANWASELTIDKSISLIGAGAGSTVITSTQADNGICVSSSSSEGCRFMIRYVPSSISDDAAVLMRISGFTLDADFKVGQILIYNNSITPHTMVRIDNNTLTDGNYSLASSGSDTRCSVMIRGPVYGVMDNNTLSDAPIVRLYGYSSGQSMWSTFGMYQPGTGNTFYVEDNTFTWDYPSHTDWIRTLDSSGWGSSWVARYNDYVADPASSALVMIWDAHPGVGSLGTYATRGREAYGNDLTSMGRFNPRCNGGQSIIFYNRDNDTSSTYTPSMVSQMDYANDDGLTVCGSNAVPSEVGQDTCAAAVDGYTQPQHPHREYEWANWWGVVPTKWPGYVSSGAIALRANTDYFNYNTSFGERTAGTSTGVGCGTLAARPTTCTTGVVYWATDQSCSDIANYVGKGPTTPIAGTLYRCSTTDNWTAYYTPYTYPHPLRGAADTTAPIASSPTPTVAQGCDDVDETEEIAITLATNENATCKWGTTTAAYASLPNTFDGTGTQSHTDTTAALACGTTHTIYYACQDTATNTSATASWSFAIAALGDAGAPTVTNLSGTTQAYSTTGQLLAVGTSEAGTCRYCTGGGCTAATAWADRTQFGTTGDTIFHSQGITQTASSTVSYHVLCQDTQGNESSNLEVSLTTTAGCVISTTGGTSTIHVNDNGKATINF